MATKLANASGLGAQMPHTSGLYADMSLDGPEIGTLVLIVDRAKNLPNRKSMGKQNPYCAARLGKEARKTETDRRGGQTPRWDQELRFIVHDSPDYERMKISVFSEDKRTDLVGEAWVELTGVIVPGGGKKDFWQDLTCKGKYAGEIRVELTYYDERPRLIEPTPAQELAQALGGDVSKVKRRPLPGTSASRHLTPDTIPEPFAPGRAKHGPRDLRAPPRANSMPNTHSSQPTGDFAPPVVDAYHTSSPPVASYQTPPQERHFDPYEQYQEPAAYGEEEEHYGQESDFLPQLPPSNRQRSSFSQRPTVDTVHSYTPPRPQLPGAFAMQHSVSAPVIPQLPPQVQDSDDGYQLHTDYPDPIPDVDYQYQQVAVRRREVGSSPGWASGNGAGSPAIEHYMDEEDGPPPPPPMHSNSSPAIPQRVSGPASSPIHDYGSTPPSARAHSIPNSSPLQSIERKYATPPRLSMQGMPSTATSPQGYSPSSQPRGYDSPTPNYPSGQSSTHFTRQQPVSRMPANRHSISDPYMTTTPPRPHPLSQEVPRPHSPQPLTSQDYYSTPSGNHFQPQQPEYRSRDGLPLIRPRPVSPQTPQPLSQPSSAPRSRGLYDIQFPIRAFASSDNNPLSTSQPHSPAPVPQSDHSTPLRKSVSPRPTPPNSAGGMPYSPDSFNVHNPHARESTLSTGNSPHSPYQIRPGSETAPFDGDADSPFVDWHGKEIDPSDHLPVNSWAPEPEKKTPVRSYGLGRDRDFGPRTPQSTGSGSGGARKNLSKDTVVSVRLRTQSQPAPAPAEPTSFRNRLQKKTTPSKVASAAAAQPLQERHNFNSVSSPVDSYEQHQYQQDCGSGGYYADQQFEPHAGAYQGSYTAMSDDALSREIESIDIGGRGGYGGGRHVRAGSVPAPIAYVPVRSHKDRRTLY